MSTLLALSDALVMRALERAASRGLPGHARDDCRRDGIPQHRAYLHRRIEPAKIPAALNGAWAFTSELVYRWDLPIDPGDWATVLHGYTRGLLLRQDPHRLDDLASALPSVGAGHAIL
jgi:hypothetical protein